MLSGAGQTAGEYGGSGESFWGTVGEALGDALTTAGERPGLAVGVAVALIVLGWLVLRRRR